jgi:type III secretory pathway component EscU
VLVPFINSHGVSRIIVKDRKNLFSEEFLFFLLDQVIKVVALIFLFFIPFRYLLLLHRYYPNTNLLPQRDLECTRVYTARLETTIDREVSRFSIGGL